MSDFTIEFQNGITNWEWAPGQLIATQSNNGIFFNDNFIVPDITDKYRCFTWTNFRILCNNTYNKINIWATQHSSPSQLDLAGRKHQSGDAQSTYATYRTVSSVFNDSDRFYLWIKATNKTVDYAISQSISDNLMYTKAVSVNGGLIPINSNISSWLGWDPELNTDGAGIYAHKIDYTSRAIDVARWIIGWDNTCCGVLTNSINPAIGLEYQASILDTYSMIDGMNGNSFLGCESGSYIYGKMLFSLENHDSPQALKEANYSSYRLLNTIGFKSFQINIGALLYQ